MVSVLIRCWKEHLKLLEDLFKVIMVFENGYSVTEKGAVSSFINEHLYDWVIKQSINLAILGHIQIRS